MKSSYCTITFIQVVQVGLCNSRLASKVIFFLSVLIYEKQLGSSAQKLPPQRSPHNLPNSRSATFFVTLPLLYLVLLVHTVEPFIFFCGMISDRCCFYIYVFFPFYHLVWLSCVRRFSATVFRFLFNYLHSLFCVISLGFSLIDLARWKQTAFHMWLLNLAAQPVI